MGDRAAIEAKVAGLEEMLEKIQAELSAKEVGVQNLGDDRKAAMLKALQKGKRANTDGLSDQIARLEAQAEGLTAEVEIAENLLSHAREELAPFLIREELLEAVQKWEKCCYQVKALHDGKATDWDALRDYHKACFERDEVGLQVLVDAGVAPEGELRRHGGESNYLAGLDHYVPFSGMYPENWIILRQMQRELKGSEVKPPEIRAVSARTISQALQQAEGDSMNRLVKYKAFEDFYIVERPDDSPYDELRGGVVFHYG